MGFKLFEEKIGALTHNSGVISLAPSVLNVGGQQYVTSTLSRTISTDVTLTANGLYMVFVVISGGALQLRISSNANSVGPSGFTYWKLVGAFYANGLASVAFGSFVNIYGTPSTELIDYISTITVDSGSITNYTHTAKFRRFGEKCNFSMVINFSAPSAVFYGLTCSGPTQFIPNNSKNINSSIGKLSALDNGIAWYVGGVMLGAGVNVSLYWVNSSATPAIFNNFANNSPIIFDSLDSIQMEAEYNITGWSNTQLADL